MKYGKIVVAAAVVAAAMNLSFAGAPRPGVPSGWTATGISSGDYIIGFDPEQANDGRPSVFIESHGQPQGKFAALSQTVEATPWRGKLVEFSVVTKSLGKSEAEIWVRGIKDATSEKKSTWTASQSITVEGWKETKVSMIVPQEAERLEFGIGMRNAGKVWLHDAKLRQGAPEEQEKRAQYRPLASDIPVGEPAPAAVNLQLAE